MGNRVVLPERSLVEDDGQVKIIMLLIVCALTGCAGMTIENSIGVDPDDNAALCASADIDPAWSESNLKYTRVELPRDFTVTPSELAELLRACNVD